ncbi:uncharacterized protein N7529_002183 [Penicillium soppii]|uniref:uncharacterized protein n=1 Tax=Penicillium soppii TaxID=69789 RepID=UPI0025493522|nr:uncharacterized protein N7529_002183 [Penicillium soppii]KAJ5873753.1 hypothetical protein N7529_002183 [Penicillium soppii]
MTPHRHPRGSPDSSLRLTAMSPLLLFHDADTLVYIDPSPETTQASFPLSTPTVPHRVHSEKLFATGSAYFKRLFSPQQQTRVQKRRGLIGQLPAGFQYVLDLTPPLMDEDAILVLTELSCPMDIRTWASKQETWDLPQSCVGGQDYMEADEALTPILTDPGSDTDINSLKGSSSVDLQLQGPKRAVLPLEYSAQRHREAIEHILQVLEGLNPILDTPCNLWTFFGVAKIFDVATSPMISGHIISWFYELKNTRFIELHPEVVYPVACGIKCACLCREAFVELVADAALLYLITLTYFQPVNSMKMLVRSTICDVLDDTELQRIEYASKSFGDYVLRCFSGLAGRQMSWLEHLADYQKIVRHYHLYPEDRKFILSTMQVLKEFIRDRIYGTLVNARDANRTFLAASDEDKYSDLDYQYLKEQSPHKMFILQRLIGKDFWRSLSSLDLHRESAVRRDSHSTIAEIGNNSSVFADEIDATIRHVSNDEIYQVCQAFNQLAITRLRIRQEEEEEAERVAGERRVMLMTINVRQMEPAAGDHSPSKDGPALDPTPAPTPNPTIEPAAPSPPPSDLLNHIVSVVDLKTDVGTFLANYAAEMLKMPESHTIRHELTDILSCLTYNEYQYLPLWADGNDDGTGGVFTDHIIPAMNGGGFSAPGPVICSGSAISINNSLVDIDQSDAQSTIHAASHHATHNHISDVVSIGSTSDAHNLTGIELIDEGQGQPSLEGIQYDQDQYDDVSFDLGLATDDEEFEARSDCTLIDKGSNSASDTSEDTKMEGMDDEIVDSDFELLEFSE